MIGFNDCYYEFIHRCCLSLIHTMMIYLSIRSLKSTLYDIFHCIKQYFNNSNDNFDGYELENDNNMN